MSASATSMHEWFSAFRESVLPQLDEIHPSARSFCHEYLNDMRCAIECGDNTELARLLRLIESTIADELAWNVEVERSADDPGYTPKYTR
jgi:hypothetical protein